MAKIKINSRYGITPNELLNNKEVTLKAKGLYAYIQSKSDDWDFSAEKIAIQSKESIDAIKTGLRELESAGYLQRVKVHNEKGYFEIEYILYEKPIQVIPTKDIPMVDFPTLDNGTDNSKKDLSKKDIKNKDLDKEISKEILSSENNSIPKRREGSIYGDGELDYLCVEFYQKNPTKYPAEMYKDFLTYWTAPIINGSKKDKGKELWRTHKTFQVSGRLSTWHQNNLKRVGYIQPNYDKSKSIFG